MSDCLPCGTGYLCNKKGIADKDDFLCPLGFYCPLTNTDDSTKVACPGGRYRNTTGAAVETDCPVCPGGYYCPNNTINPIPCRGTYYCPIGSSVETICPQGNHCHERETNYTI